ncbi:hypothetical protein OG542_00240 [Streptomyces violaceus]|uniref:hypothetical protein n=1 Tax=Streptomyces violaceus TaxID=1936 RepID=UPI002E21C559
MTHLFADGAVTERVHTAMPALIVVAVATAVHAGADALAVYAATRLALETAAEADLQILDLAPKVELEA